MLTDGNIQWSALGPIAGGTFKPTIATYTPPGEVDTAGGIFHNASGTAVDEQGNGTLFQYWSPGQGGQYTNFVQVNGVGRTFGLLQASNGLPTPTRSGRTVAPDAHELGQPRRQPGRQQRRSGQLDHW